MWLPKAFYRAMLPAAIVLPLWLLIGRGLIVSGPGWEFVLLIFVCPILAVLMAGVAGLIIARKSVRRAAAVSWADVGMLSAWYAVIIAAGLVSHDVMAVLVVVVSVLVFWAAVWMLFSETRNRVKTALASLEYTAVPTSEYRNDGRSTHDAPGAGTVIRVDPPRT